jgi:hypothetical protein
VVFIDQRLFQQVHFDPDDHLGNSNALGFVGKKHSLAINKE